MGELTQELVRKLFEYREDGCLIWKYHPDKSKKYYIGTVAGMLMSDGYYRVSILGKKYRLHRVIFLYHKGYLPEFPVTIDHITGNRDDNRIENLREATKSQQNYNKPISNSNTSGIKGVCWDKTNRKWKTKVESNGKRYTVGYFSDIEEAKNAVRQLREKLHGEFCNHG